jgi:glycopeptide antibiotics resistance protein
LRRPLSTILLAAWAVLLLDMTLRWFPKDRPPPNLAPFRSIRHDWREGGRHLWVNFVGNLVVFVPAGALLPRAWPWSARAGRVALVAAAFSASVEAAQYASGRRVADVDDVLLNATGALVGYGLAMVIDRRRGESLLEKPAGSA